MNFSRKLKILHVITTIERGGAENQLLVLVRHQISMGNQVAVAYLKGKPELESALQSAGAKIYFLEGSFGHKIVHLINLLKKNFDIAHAHLPRSELLLALAKIISRNSIPLVASRHNSESFFPKAPRPIPQILSIITLSKYVSVIFISNAVQDFLSRAGEIPKSINREIIYYGYDEKFGLTVDNSQNAQREFCNYLFVGRLTAQKNLGVLLEAFRMALKQNPNYQLNIYGEGELESKLKSLVEDIPYSIFWHGKSAEIYKKMLTSSCLILPSKYEGFGLVLLEAMQSELPILAARNSAIPEVLGQNHPGLFNTFDSDSLSKLILRVQEPAFREELLLHQSKRLKMFEPAKMTTLIQLIYERILNGMNRRL